MFSLKNKKNVDFWATKSWLDKWILTFYLPVDKLQSFRRRSLKTLKQMCNMKILGDRPAHHNDFKVTDWDEYGTV